MFVCREFAFFCRCFVYTLHLCLLIGGEWGRRRRVFSVMKELLASSDLILRGRAFSRPAGCWCAKESNKYGRSIGYAEDKWVLPFGQKVRIYPKNGKPFDGQVADVGGYDKVPPKKATPEGWIDVWYPKKNQKKR